MEIERKWLVEGWPQGLAPVKTFVMRQGYVTTRPTVRIRSEESEGKTDYILCFKGKASADGLAALTEGAVWLEGTRFDPGAAREEVAAWVDGLGL